MKIFMVWPNTLSPALARCNQSLACLPASHLPGSLSYSLKIPISHARSTFIASLSHKAFSFPFLFFFWVLVGLDEKYIWDPKSLRFLPRASKTNVISSELFLTVSFVPMWTRRKEYVSVGFTSYGSPVTPPICPSGRQHTWWVYGSFWHISV